jgi:2-oxo-4-hydroxy-4-carboxy--5-ureidoimidazoline (OHCU) decarboxylase
VRELPRQLSVEELAALFEGRTHFAEQLAGVEDPLGRAPELARGLSEQQKKEVLDAHPAIGAAKLSARSAAEQGSDEDAAVLAQLAELNRAYEEKFGFRFVVFVDRRPKAAIVPVLRERLERSRAQELETALDELVEIARDRWRRG